jgi:hypothetical protein
MTEETKQPLSMIERLKLQHTGYCQQHEKAKATVSQLEGAIIAIENLIKQHHKDETDAKAAAEKEAEAKRIEDQLKIDELTDMKMDMEIQQGANEDGRANDQATE